MATVNRSKVVPSPSNEVFKSDFNRRRKNKSCPLPINGTCLCSFFGGLAVVVLFILSIIIPVIITLSIFATAVSSTNTTSIATVSTAATPSVGVTTVTNTIATTIFTSATTVSTTTATTTSTSATTVTTTTATTTSTSATTVTTTISGCGSMCQTTLLLSDTNTATVQTLVNDLQSAGLSVNYISGGISSYTGSPDASSYGSVILITGDSYSLDMPISGQQSIVNAQQNNGTGVVMTEWAAYQVSSARWSTLSSLLLATRITGSTTSMSYTLVSSGHPIWNGLATSFNTSVTLGYSTLGTLSNGSTIVANSTTLGTPVVVVRPVSGVTGRIVQIAHASHYSVGGFNWGNDANVVTMMINAVQWAAQII